MEDEIEKTIEEGEALEPQVTSSDPEERKIARRLRIERRLENIRKQAIQQEGDDKEEVVEKSPVQKQLEKSAEYIQKLIIEGEEYITNVRVANDSREVDRRELEGIGREKIFEKLEEEANSAQDMFDEISKKWASILKYNDPLSINEEIQSQKEKCEELIKQKDAIIMSLKDELKTAEINFTNDQRKQIDDINTLTQRIESQVILMRQAYRQELQLVEDMVVLERKMLIEANDKKWEELFKKREEEEQINSKRIFEILDEFFVEATRLRHEHEELYRATKIRLEKDIQLLQQELARIKALCMLNSEKLDYNYQILRKREDENIIIKSQQKRRINKLQDIINTLSQKIIDYEETTENEIKRLNAEVQKLKKGIDDTEAKTEHFSEVNQLKYKQVWDLNVRRAVEILDKILAIDKVIHEQQLGIEWKAPDLSFLQNQFDITNLKKSLYVGKHLTVDEKKAEPESNTTDPEKTQEELKEEEKMLEIDRLKNERLLTQILEKIADNTGFLIESRLKLILKPYSSDQNTLVRIDNVFTALGIVTRDDVDLLIKYFVPYAYCPICSKNPYLSQTALKYYDEIPGEDEDTELQLVTDKDLISATKTAICSVQQPEEVLDGILEKMLDKQESSESEDDLTSERSITVRPVHSETIVTRTSLKTVCPKNHPLMITSIYVLRALRDFVSRFFVVHAAKPSLTMRIAKRREIMNTIEEKNVEPFFEKFKEFINKDRENLWDGLLVGLQKYHMILKARKDVHDEVLKLRQQNDELKHLLATYIQSHAVLDPPCAANRQQPYTKSPLEKLYKKY